MVIAELRSVEIRRDKRQDARFLHGNLSPKRSWEVLGGLIKSKECSMSSKEGSMRTGGQYPVHPAITNSRAKIDTPRRGGSIRIQYSRR